MAVASDSPKGATPGIAARRTSRDLSSLHELKTRNAAGLLPSRTNRTPDHSEGFPCRRLTYIPSGQEDLRLALRVISNMSEYIHLDRSQFKKGRLLGIAMPSMPTL